MAKRSYTHVQTFLPEIKAMVEAGKTQRKIAECYGFKDRTVVKKACSAAFLADSFTYPVV